jgi:hypothetical protein
MGAAVQNLMTSRAAGAGGDTGDKNPLVDTRILGKPSPFSGDTDTSGRNIDGPGWFAWSFTMRAYASALSPRMSEMMVAAASVSELTEAIDHSSLSPEDLRCSVTLFYVLALLLKGKALAILQTVQETLGIEAWRPGVSLHMSLNRRSQGGSVACLTSC